MKLLLGDALDILPTLPDCSIDAVVTDPPYGIGFMGKEWDVFSPTAVAAAEARRERKATERTSETWPEKIGERQGGGANVQYDESPNGNRRFQEWCRAWAEGCLRVLRPGGHLLSFGGTRTYHRVAAGVEDAGFEIRDSVMWLFGSGFPKSKNLDGDWEGWGTALKPGHEPIVVARKPLDGTVAGNVDRHGTGALNIDGCRIPGEGGGVSREGEASAERRYRDRGATQFTGVPGPRGGDADGRWPSNVILDEAAADDLDRQSGTLTSGANPARRGSDKFRDICGDFKGQEDATVHRGKDVGGASRFFYVAKTSRSERNAGLDDFEERPLLWSSGEQSPGTFQAEGTKRAAKNNHPTVKPIALMRHLVRLVTPPGGTVLDPFMGSGTTGIAAALEGFNFLGIEREADYVEIARARIEHFSLNAPPVEDHRPPTPKPSAAQGSLL